MHHLCFYDHIEAAYYGQEDLTGRVCPECKFISKTKRGLGAHKAHCRKRINGTYRYHPVKDDKDPMIDRCIKSNLTWFKEFNHIVVIDYKAFKLYKVLMQFFDTSHSRLVVKYYETKDKASEILSPIQSCQYDLSKSNVLILIWNDNSGNTLNYCINLLKKQNDLKAHGVLVRRNYQGKKLYKSIPSYLACETISII